MKQTTQNYGGEKGYWAIWQWWERLKEDTEAMRVCLYQNLCCTVLKPRVLKFCLKMCRHAYIFYCMNLRASRDPHWFHVEGPEMSPLETAGLRLFVSTLWLLYVARMQQTGHPVAPLSMSQREWTTEPSTESCDGGETSGLGHSCVGVSKMGTSHFC